MEKSNNIDELLEVLNKKLFDQACLCQDKYILINDNEYCIINFREKGYGYIEWYMKDKRFVDAEFKFDFTEYIICPLEYIYNDICKFLLFKLSEQKDRYNDLSTKIKGEEVHGNAKQIMISKHLDSYKDCIEAYGDILKSYIG